MNSNRQNAGIILTILLIGLLCGLNSYAADTKNAERQVTPEIPKPAQTAPTKAENTLPTEAVSDNINPSNVYVVPIEGVINAPQLYILRRALKEAIDNEVNTVILQMDTPGGDLATTLEMMDALDKFDGTTITFVDTEAISAGSYIAIATDDIYFAPKGIMGAAEAVTGTGEDIAEGMQRKINSYLRAKVRMLAESQRYRGDVQRAMMDPEFEFKIGDRIIKPAGELLSLTANEAIETFGDPPEPLLAQGIAKDVDELLSEKFGAENYTIKEFKVTWSENFAKWFKGISPILLGIGLLLIFIEIKTPNFGLIGGAGIVLLLLVFASNYFAGIAGHEEVLFFLLGVILLALEIFAFPGIIVMGMLGLILMVGSLLWAMADIWPGHNFTITPQLFYIPLIKLLIGVAIAFFGIFILGRLLPKTRLWNKIVLSSAIKTQDKTVAVAGQRDQTSSTSKSNQLPAIGATGIAASDLHPMGQVEIDGNRYQATLRIGVLKKGQSIVVVDHQDYSLVVKRET